MTEETSEVSLYGGTPEDYAAALKRPAGEPPARRAPSYAAVHGSTGARVTSVREAFATRWSPTGKHSSRRSASRAKTTGTSRRRSGAARRAPSPRTPGTSRRPRCSHSA